MAAMQLGKGAFLNVVHPGFFALYLVSFCTTVSVKMSLFIHYCLIYKLILLSSESENGKWELATEVPSETFQRQGALVIIHFCHITAAFFKKIHLPLSYLAPYMQICFFSTSKSALRTSQFLWLHCTASTNA